MKAAEDVSDEGIHFFESKYSILSILYYLLGVLLYIQKNAPRIICVLVRFTASIDSSMAEFPTIENERQTVHDLLYLSPVL